MQTTVSKIAAKVNALEIIEPKTPGTGQSIGSAFRQACMESEDGRGFGTC